MTKRAVRLGVVLISLAMLLYTQRVAAGLMMFFSLTILVLFDEITGFTESDGVAGQR